MNILLIPAFNGGISHQIPLYVLYKTYLKDKLQHNTAFLLPKKNHESFLRQGVTVLPIDYSESIDISDHDQMRERTLKLLDKEGDAIAMFNPSIIIEDSSTITYINCLKFNIPRISVHRTGFFRSISNSLKNPEHIHSLEKGKSIELPKHLIFTIKKDSALSKSKSEVVMKATIAVREMILTSKAKIIPGIPSIEKLPKRIEHPQSYFYSGPLILQDNSSQALLAELNAFISINEGRKKIFISTGLIEQQNITPIIDLLLERNYCIISTVSIKCPNEYSAQFYYNPFLPLNTVCSKADLIVHHCGSGIYHYPIVHLKPTITLGTQCYDREDVALRLEQLGVSKHTPSPFDSDDYLEIFKTNMTSFEQDKICNINTLLKLRNEIFEAMRDFDIETVLNYTVDQPLTQEANIRKMKL